MKNRHGFEIALRGSMKLWMSSALGLASDIRLVESGGIMNRLSVALLAVAATLSITPAAMADSFSYAISGSNFTSNVTFTTGDTAVNNLPGPSGNVSAYVITSVTGSFNIIGGPTYNFTDAQVVLPDNGANANNLEDNGSFEYDNLLYAGLSGNDVLDWGGVVFSPAPGYELNLFGGGFGSGAPGNGLFYFADNGAYHSNDPVIDSSNPDGNPVFSPVPEPGSLLLFATGVLGLAFVVSRKSARPALSA
jgi:hypothetical protein